MAKDPWILLKINKFYLLHIAFFCIKSSYTLCMHAFHLGKQDGVEIFHKMTFYDVMYILIG